MKLKKYIAIGVCILLAGSFYYISYNKKFALYPEKAIIEDEISLRLNTDETIAIKQMEKVDHLLLIVFYKGAMLGSGWLEQGWNDKYKLETFGYGTNTLNQRIITTNRGTYLKITGENNDNIGLIEAKVEGIPYTVPIPEGETYITATPIQPTEHLFTNEFTVFDRDGNELYRVH